MIFFQVFTGENNAVRRMIVDDRPPVAVQNLSPGRQHRRGLHSILLGPLIVDFRIPDLKIPEPRKQEEEDADCQVLKKGDLRRGKFRVVPQQRLRQLFLFSLGLKIHGSRLKYEASPLVYPISEKAAVLRLHSGRQTIESAGDRSLPIGRAARASAPNKRIGGRSRRRNRE